MKETRVGPHKQLRASPQKGQGQEKRQRETEKQPREWRKAERVKKSPQGALETKADRTKDR